MITKKQARQWLIENGYPKHIHANEETASGQMNQCRDVAIIQLSTGTVTYVIGNGLVVDNIHTEIDHVESA